MRGPFRTGELVMDKVRTVAQAESNCLFVNPSTFAEFKAANGGKEPVYCQLNEFVFILQPETSIALGSLGIPGIIRSCLKLSQTLDRPSITHYVLPQELFMLGTLKFSVGVANAKPEDQIPAIEEQVLIDYFRKAFKGHFIGTGQEFYHNFNGVDLTMKVTDHEFVDDKTSLHFGMCFEETHMEFKSKTAGLKIKSASMKEKNIFGKKFKFEDIGVGGMDKEIINLFRRAFATRRLPSSVLEKFGKTHVKGVLLYGPPGTGKTLIAKELAKCLNSVKPIVVNGPSILSKYVGESEENVRKLFAPARKDETELGDDSPLHVIIFDEFDAIAKPRGMDSDSTGVASNVVNQLLSMIDGVEALNNVLLIGMTNRKDLIDPAILRPGRFEVHLEISLPNEEGRVQILNIHTKKMRENGILGADVDIPRLAQLTKNFTGADIESLTKSATSFSLDRHHDLMDFSKELKFTKESMMVEMRDFMKALEEVKPDFGVDEDKFESRLRGQIISYGPKFDTLMNSLQSSIKGFIQGDLPLSSILLYGDEGSGKTTVACKLAKNSNIPYLKLISGEDIIGLNEFGKVKTVQNIFNNAYKSPSSVIVIDDIERIIEYVQIGSRFNNNILQAFLTYLRKLPEKLGHKLIIIGTTSNKSIAKDLGLWDCFNLKVQIPSLQGDEIKIAMQQLCPGIPGISSLPIEKDTQISVKVLYFIANYINQKMSENPRADPGAIFFQILAQTSS